MGSISPQLTEMENDENQTMINGNHFAVFINVDGEEKYIGRVIAYSPNEAVEKAQQLPEFNHIMDSRYEYEDEEEFIVMSIGRISVHRV